jgi:hypothetical protein
MQLYDRVTIDGLILRHALDFWKQFSPYLYIFNVNKNNILMIHRKQLPSITNIKP